MTRLSVQNAAPTIRLMLTVNEITVFPVYFRSIWMIKRPEIGQAAVAALWNRLV